VSQPQHSLVRHKKQKTRFVTLEQCTTRTRASCPKSFYIDPDRHRLTLPFCPSCSSPSPGCDSLHCLSLSFLSSRHTRTSFVSLVPLEICSPFCLLISPSHFFCIILCSTGESTRRTVRYCLLSFQQLSCVQCLRSIGRKYAASRYRKPILTYFNSKQTSTFLQISS
jgi:hypothetical protein